MAGGLDHGAPTLSPDLAKLCIRQVRASGRDEPRLIAALEKAGGLKNGVRKLSDKERNELLTDVARFGDAARGESIYRRKELNCQKCHAIAGGGGQVGPGLESIGASAQPDYLVDSLLEPGKAVKENYHALAVATSDGKVYTGIKVRQTDAELVLRDADDREIAISTSSIEEQKMAGSLMPAGLTDGLTRAELIDLVRFLSQVGKIGVYSVGTDRVSAPLADPRGNSESEIRRRSERRRGASHERARAQLEAGLHHGVGAALPLRMACADRHRHSGSPRTGANPARCHHSREGQAYSEFGGRALSLDRRPPRPTGERLASRGDRGPDPWPAHIRHCRGSGTSARRNPLRSRRRRGFAGAGAGGAGQMSLMVKVLGRLVASGRFRLRSPGLRGPAEVAGRCRSGFLA